MSAHLILGPLLLLLLTENQVAAPVRVQLGISGDSFDDQYVGCWDKMASVAPDLLRAEREASEDLDAAWREASETWPARKRRIGSLPAGFADEHGIALSVYTNMAAPVYRQLNRAVREYGAGPSSSFPFHALHFYLTGALAALRPGEGRPWRTYRGSSRVLFEPPPDPGDPDLRLGQFASSSADIQEARRFGNASFFNITTRFGADVRDFSYFPSQQEVLIPVDEVFRVTNYVEPGHVFVLESTGQRCSFYNCAYLGGSKRQSCAYSSAADTRRMGREVSAPLLAVAGIVLTSVLSALIG